MKRFIPLKDTPKTKVIFETDLCEDVDDVGALAILLDLDTAYMVIKRYDGTAEDGFTTTLQQATLEEIRAEEIDELLTLWKDEAKIKINHKLIKKYRPENTVGA